MSEILPDVAEDVQPIAEGGGSRRKADHIALIDSVKISAPYALYVTSRLMVTSYWPSVRWTGVHAAESFVLLELWREQPLSQKQLSLRLKVNHASIGQTLRRLEREGMIRRWRSPTDGRVMMAETTEKGASLRDSVLSSSLQIAHEFDAILGKKDSDEFKRMLKIIADNYDKSV